MAKILIVEDDRALSSLLKDFLSMQSHCVEEVHDGTSAVDHLRCYKYDLIILDWNLPGESGIEVLKRFRAQATGSPVLLLTARSQLPDKVTGLEAGADDYMVKPVKVQEFAARVRALLRRAAVPPQKSLQWGGLQLEPASGKLTSGELKIELPRKEAELLALLMQQPGQYLSGQALLERLWEHGGTKAGLANCLKRLRGQLKAVGQPDAIETAAGLGYRLKGHAG